MEPTFRQIRYFIAVAHAGQIAQAAHELNVSQSAITTAIKHLEEIVGCALFRRHARGLNLTHNGTIFLHHAERVMVAVNEAVRAPGNDARSSLEGELRLAMTYTVAGYFMPPYLERFKRIYPAINLQLVEVNRAEIEDGLVSGQYDIAVLLTLNIAEQEKLAYETLIRSPRRLWLASGHKLSQRDKIHLGDLTNEPYIMLTVDEAATTSWRYWNQAGLRPNILMHSSSVEGVRSMVANGMGITILSNMVYRPWSLEGLRIEAVSLASPVPSMDVGLAWSVATGLSPTAEAFARFMRNEVVPEARLNASVD